MPYTVNWSDNTLKPPFALADATVDTVSSSLALTGYNTPNWGEKLEENLLHLLENFASNGVAPINPTIGQTWFNNTTKQLKIYHGSTWNDTIRHKNPATNSVITSINSKLNESIDLASDYNVTGTGDESAKVQNAIDDLPASGGVINWPPFTVTCHNIRMQGTAGGKNNVIIKGKGRASKAVAPTGSSNNVFEGINITGAGIEDLEIVGTRGNGGNATIGPSRGLAAPGMLILTSDRVEVSSADAYTTTVSATNKVYRCIAPVTLGASFATTLLTNFALTTEPNFNTVDLSYRYNNGVYFDNAAECYVKNVRVINCIYAAFNFGSGPVQPANVGPGTDFCKIMDSFCFNCDNAVAGGRIRDILIDGLSIKNNINYGIVIDGDSGDIQITNVNIQSTGNHGIFAYNAATVTIDGYTISDCLNGIVVENGSTLISIGQGTIKNSTNIPLFVRNSPLVTVNGLSAHNNVDGVTIDSTYACTIIGAMISGTSGAGKSNIIIKSASIVTICAGTISTLANLHGIHLDACDQVVITAGVTCFNNNTSNNVDGSGIFANNTTNLNISGVSCFDTRLPGSKTQKYGIKSIGTSDNYVLGNNRLDGNDTARFSLAGSTNRIIPDFADFTNASVAANFTADKLVTYVDTDGTIMYLPARLGAW